MNIGNWLINNRENIISLIELEDIHSKNDPCEQPYRSQYAARDILQSCITNLEEQMLSCLNSCNSVTFHLFLSLSYRLANNFISTEERHSGEEIINSIYEKIQRVPQINAFIQHLERKIITAVGDVTKIEVNPINTEVTESGESQSDDNIAWMRSITGILIKIYNTKGMLWALQIMNYPQDSSSEIDDPGFLNSFKYLNMAKKLYKKYKGELRNSNIDSALLDEQDFDYSPPECIDSVLLDYLNYETPYLKYECGLLDEGKKKEAVKLDVFESDYTATLFLLAQAFGKISSHNSMKHKSAKYCYKTLSRQLNSLKYDPVEWALNAATLSQYYVLERGFKRARHCIAASQVILKEAIIRPTFGPNHNESKLSATDKKVVDNVGTTSADKELEENKTTCITNDESGSTTIDCQKTVDSILEESLDAVIDQIDIAKINTNENADVSLNSGNEEKNDETTTRKKLFPDPMSESRFWDDDVYEEKRVQAAADIDRCWIKYGLTILENSFDRFMPDASNNKANDYAINDSNFPEFNLELESIERQVTCSYVDTFDEARELFLFVQKRINDSRKFYRIDYRCSDAIELICDHSKAFKALSNFEYSVERKCCMHKKRIDMLGDLLNTLNQTYYQVACRTMMLEVGEIYSTMMSLKMSLIETPTGQDKESVQSFKNAKAIALKIKRLAQNGIEIYQKFLDSYRNRDAIMPEIFAEDDIRPVMIAHFYMARMYSKIVEPDTKERVCNLRKSLEHYQFIVNYCDMHTVAANQMSSELGSCRDMAVLLPHKIHKLLDSM